jgi:hypothetical protein
VRCVPLGPECRWSTAGQRNRRRSDPSPAEIEPQYGVRGRGEGSEAGRQTKRKDENVCETDRKRRVYILV